MGVVGGGGMANSVACFGLPNFTFLLGSLLWLLVETVTLTQGVSGASLFNSVARGRIGWNLHISFIVENSREIPEIQGM